MSTKEMTASLVRDFLESHPPSAGREEERAKEEDKKANIRVKTIERELEEYDLSDL